MNKPNEIESREHERAEEDYLNWSSDQASNVLWGNAGKMSLPKRLRLAQLRLDQLLGE